MQRRFQILILSTVVLSVAGSAGASAGTVPKVVAVRVEQKPSVAGSLHITFRPPGRLPQGGYYYAVVVLRPYKGYTRKEPPPCATSSDMERTDYSYPHSGHPVALALTPAKSTTGHWCAGGSYIGAVYAVPHAPPCNSNYPCRSETYEGSPCFKLKNGPRVCGVVAHPKLYSYPDGLPSPIERGTRIIGHFHITF
jgi:hypothetical protein